ncbi:MAG: polysaccharide deacetylase family protein [Bacteroidaceae bacterium]|jgi:peptidoglycan/xylan/chitin deacetylase (PgdA/CDA1 family)|nr:polysaccharide deacetylase family protein [Bacteroidaceae bacterium]
MFIEQPSKWLRWLYPDAIWRMDKKEKAVYLTFDDGPIPESTPWLIETLDKYDVKATFFMVGDNVRKYPELLELIRSHGHRLGNHTFNHIGGLKVWSWQYLWNANKADKLIHTNLFRPPHGWMKPLQYIRLRRHYTVIMWDLVTRDYSRLLTADDVFENVKRYARNGSIITFHDSLKSIDKLKTALPRSIEWLRDQGYEFRIFDEDLRHNRRLK